MILVLIIITSSMYIYLHIKTGMRLRFLFIDGSAVIVISVLVLLGLRSLVSIYIGFSAALLLIPLSGFCITMIRFYRKPKRGCSGEESDIISPADGKVIAIRTIEAGEDYVSEKKGLRAYLTELSGTDLAASPSVLVSINMTPFDVHTNSAPIGGTVREGKHIGGQFLSLKNP